MIRNSEKIPAHLPKRLTISFPIWGLYDTEHGGKYHDYDVMMQEHRKRGFNCIRLDDGAGIMHDSSGKPRGAVRFGYIFGEHDKALRQFAAAGEPGMCDPHKRLIDLFEAAKRHDMYIILSSWYYLHTCWLIKDHSLNSELHSIVPLERFDAFAKFLHYIICELEERGLDDRIAFAEIFNEADGLRFINGYGDENHLTDEELAVFRQKHEEAIAWLQEKHPNILFGFDSWTYRTDLRQVPGNMQVYNFHNYFLWTSVYDLVDREFAFLKDERISKEALKAMADCDYPPTDDWYHRAWYFANLDPKNVPQAAGEMTAYLKQYAEAYRNGLHKSFAHVENNLDHFLPQVPVVCGEGVSYSGGYQLVWEEYSEEYWSLVREMMEGYRRMGLWGTVVRTCCGPEDPVWNLCPEKLLEMNQVFLGDD